MGFYTGRSGHIKIGNKKLAKIRDWSLETTVELISTNNIQSTVNTYTAGVKGATGSATLMYYRITAEEKANFHQFTKLLNQVLKTGGIGAQSTVSMELNVGGADKDDIKFKAFITSATVSVSSGELSVIPINFTVDGDFTEVIDEALP